MNSSKNNDNQWKTDLFDPIFDEIALEIPELPYKLHNKKKPTHPEEKATPILKTKRNAVRRLLTSPMEVQLRLREISPELQVQTPNRPPLQSINRSEGPNFSNTLRFAPTPVSRTSSTESEGSDPISEAQNLVSLQNLINESSNSFNLSLNESTNP